MNYDLINRYREPHRVYHDLRHIYRMLSVYEEHRNKTFPEISMWHESALMSAIWYHDVIFDLEAPAGVNEHDSAKYYFDTTGDSSSIEKQVIWMIEATALHFKGEDAINIHLDKADQWAAPEDWKTTCKILLDLDLESFSSHYDDFQEINNRLYYEYLNSFSAEEVLEGRLAFLNGILENTTLRYRAFKNARSRISVAYGNIMRYIDELNTELKLLKDKS